MAPDLIVRAALVVLAVSSAWGAPTWFAAPFVLLAVAAVAERVVRGRRFGGLHAWVVGLGGVLVVLVLLGLLLDRLSPGLTRVSWAVGLGIVGLLALIASARQGRPKAYPLPAAARLARGVAWYAAAAGVLAVALVASVRSTTSSEAAPLALSVHAGSSGTAEILVTASRATGPLRLAVATDGGGAAQPVAGEFRLAAGTAVTRAVVVPAGRRVTVRLTDSRGAMLRSVILAP